MRQYLAIGKRLVLAAEVSKNGLHIGVPLVYRTDIRFICVSLQWTMEILDPGSTASAKLPEIWP
jgi:hypothetical protein